MAKILFESANRDEAHRFQARVIQDGSAPRACCTDHNERGSTVVWSDNLAATDLDILATLPRVK